VTKYLKSVVGYEPAVERDEKSCDPGEVARAEALIRGDFPDFLKTVHFARPVNSELFRHCWLNKKGSGNSQESWALFCRKVLKDLRAWVDEQDWEGPCDTMLVLRAVRQTLGIEQEPARPLREPIVTCRIGCRPDMTELERRAALLDRNFATLFNSGLTPLQARDLFASKFAFRAWKHGTEKAFREVLEQSCLSVEVKSQLSDCLKECLKS